MGKDRKFTLYELIEILDAAMEKKLGDVDINNVFAKTIEHPKITGIAGDVVEQSILGFDPDNKAEPDIEVDGELIEVKTTGIRKSKEDFKVFEAKEPVSVTAVSPDTIITETFYESKFWHKIRKILFVFYEYASYDTVTAAEYADFFLRGYEIFQFSTYDKRILKKDWELVQKFIIYLRSQPGFDEIEYARLSHDLRDKLMYIDTAPKWPNPPRFRLKRSLITAIVQEYFAKNPIVDTLTEISDMAELDSLCHSSTNKYKDKTVKELADMFGINITYGKNGKPNKSITERIAVAMLGGKSKKINSLDIFKKAGIMGKTIVFSPTDSRTEDTKLFTIDFDDWTNPDVKFEDSQIYDYFANHQLLFIQFKETIPDNLLESKFLGFKRISFDDKFIFDYAKRIWDIVRDLVFNKKLVETVRLTKDGKQRINKNGTISTELNFPKSKDHENLFMRGTGEDSAHKTLVLNEIRMYQQQVWIRGTDIIALLESKKYL